MSRVAAVSQPQGAVRTTIVSTVCGLAAALMPLVAAHTAWAHCGGGNTLWGYDHIAKRIVTIDQGTGALTTVVMLPSNTDLVGIDWSDRNIGAGYGLVGLGADGVVYPIDVQTGDLNCGGAVGCVYEGMFGGIEVARNLTRSSGHWMSAVYQPYPANEKTILKESASANPPLMTPLMGNFIFSGLDAYDCDLDFYVGVIGDQMGTIQMFTWTYNVAANNWGYNQIGPVTLGSNEKIESLAIDEVGNAWVWANGLTGRLYRYMPDYVNNLPVVPDLMGSATADIRGLAFGPTAPPAATPTPDPQSKDQQKCINGLNKDGLKAFKTQDSVQERCLKDTAKGKVTDFVACYGTAEVPTAKIQKVYDKTTADDTKLCSGSKQADFAYTGGGSALVVRQSLALLEKILGSSLSTAPISSTTNKTGATCQQKLLKAVGDLAEKKIFLFNDCKKGLLDAGAGLATALHACVGVSDPVVTKAEQKVRDVAAKYCTGVSSSLAFPGYCSSNATPAALASCLISLTSCPACESAEGMDNLGLDCDTLDNGVADTSCPF